MTNWKESSKCCTKWFAILLIHTQTTRLMLAHRLSSAKAQLGAQVQNGNPASSSASDILVSLFLYLPLPISILLCTTKMMCLYYIMYYLGAAKWYFGLQHFCIIYGTQHRSYIYQLIVKISLKISCKALFHQYRFWQSSQYEFFWTLSTLPKSFDPTDLMSSPKNSCI